MDHELVKEAVEVHGAVVVVAAVVAAAVAVVEFLHNIPSRNR